MSQTLYDLATDIQAWQEAYEVAETPEQLTECEGALARAFGLTADKVDRYVRYIIHLEDLDHAIAAEQSRLRDRRQRIANAAAAMREYAIVAIDASGRRELNGTLSGLALRRCPDSVEVETELLIPAHLMTIKTVMTPNKRAIMDEYKVTGIAPAGTTIRQGRNALVIK